MNLENFSIEKANGPSRLALLARETPDKCLIVAQLDRPIVLTQENRLELPSMRDETRTRLEKLGFPNEILDVIGSEAEARIYEDANLEPTQVNGKEALVRTDIDYDQKDALGRTNLERMKLGLAPLDTEGKPIELHHIGQKSDSPLAELTRDEHRGNGNDNVLHNKLKESEIVRDDFDKERKDYWKARAEQIEKQQ
ncbi:HNH/ENDO VII superfamily nuclease [Pseudomonas duriflava]|uniref:HNH/ENDO VII superfamily nuclease n=1 Tax=Pseudomonas duriflava TaxID=459528 RepID=A0A562PYU6_9PSED|nr:HNH/ENDO VII family nuclease [Pseudomonas duriflava]TWI49615.1 HNH/ENDO VII superfamily nuclease [Pseudomonas duriflava]